MRNYFGEDHLTKWVGVSFAGHIILTLILTTALPKPRLKEIYVPDYKVNLVTLDRPKKIKTPVAAKKVGRKSSVAAKKAVSSKKKLKRPVTKSIKSVWKPVDTSAAINILRKKHATDIEIEEKVARLRREEASRLPARSYVDRKKEALRASKPQKINRSDMNGKIQAYYDMLGEKIKESWIVPGNLNIRGITAIVSILIAPSGKLIDVYIEEKSGNGFYDHSAMRAVKKAAPYQALPAGYGSGIEIGFLFRDEEVR